MTGLIRHPEPAISALSRRTMLRGNRRGRAGWRCGGAAPHVAGPALPCRSIRRRVSRPIWSTSPASIPRLRFDIRYATTDNFMGRVLYPVARAVTQRPAGRGAVSRADPRRGGGIWPADLRRLSSLAHHQDDVGRNPARQNANSSADPASGSRHNRGCSIDLSLHRDGVEVTMPSPYDDFTPAALSQQHRCACGGARGEPDAGRLGWWPKASCRLPMNGGISIGPIGGVTRSWMCRWKM